MSETVRQRWYSVVIVVVASAMALVAFLLAKACGCSERMVTAIVGAAFVAGLPLGGAVCR